MAIPQLAFLIKRGYPITGQEIKVLVVITGSTTVEPKPVITGATECSAADLEVILREKRLVSCPICKKIHDRGSIPPGNFQCNGCQNVFFVNGLSYEELREIARIHMANTVFCSRNDIQYDPSRFITRKDADERFEQFQQAGAGSGCRLFLLLGQAGFGKTWLLAHWSNRLVADGHVVFFVRLRDGIDNFFSLEMGTSRDAAIADIIRLSQALGKRREKIYWILDGYDEIGEKDRKWIITDFLRSLGRSQKQLIVLSSRFHEWNSCTAVKHNLTIISPITWDPGKIGASFVLSRLTGKETDAAIKSYKVPAPKFWSLEFQPLARHPLWIRLVSAWHKEHAVLPCDDDHQLLREYLNRMDIDENKLLHFSTFCKSLMAMRDFRGWVGRISWSTDPVDALVSAGLLESRKSARGNEENQLAEIIFGWFGAATFGVHHNDRSKNAPTVEAKKKANAEWSDFKRVINKLDERDSFSILVCMEAMGVPLSNVYKAGKEPPRYRSFKEYLRLRHVAHERMGMATWDQAARTWAQIGLLCKENGWRAGQLDADKKTRTCLALDRSNSEYIALLAEDLASTDHQKWMDIKLEWQKLQRQCRRFGLEERSEAARAAIAAIDSKLAAYESYTRGMEDAESRVSSSDLDGARDLLIGALRTCEREGWKKEGDAARKKLNDVKREMSIQKGIYYSALLLNAFDIKINEDAIKKVIDAAGGKADMEKIKRIVKTIGHEDFRALIEYVEATYPPTP
ncbi:MAG: hypothetical protein JW839_04585 [Candidatus Lokiarchaeota archaeon]|nr:hypothetical protein [Candidatus Lokiarchaeota archaeon]